MRKPNLKKAAKVVLKVADAVADAEVLPVVPQTILETALKVGQRMVETKKTCLNCRWSGPTYDASMLSCGWPMPTPVPSAVSIKFYYIGVVAPLKDCPAWEAK